MQDAGLVEGGAAPVPEGGDGEVCAPHPNLLNLWCAHGLMYVCETLKNSLFSLFSCFFLACADEERGKEEDHHSQGADLARADSADFRSVSQRRLS